MTVSDAKLVLSELIDKYYVDSLLKLYDQALTIADATVQIALSSIQKLQILGKNKDVQIKNLNDIISNKDTEIKYLQETVIIQYVEIKKQKIYKTIGFVMTSLLTLILIL